MICVYAGIVVFAVALAFAILLGMAAFMDWVTRRWPDSEW